MLMNTHISANIMWENYLKSINEPIESSEKSYEAWAFGADAESANALSALVLEGKKTATSSLHCLYADEGEALPEENAYSIILDGNGEAQCVIKTTKVNIMPFNEVTETFAKTEGEGDMTIEYWRKVHKAFFSSALEKTDKTFDENMFVVCETFEVVYY